MAEYNFIEYTPETAEAIKKARSLPPSGSSLPPYPDIHPQQFLNPPQQMIEGSGSEITGPFDVKIENGSVIVYDSSENANIYYAGWIKIGSHNAILPTTSINISTGTLYLNVEYNPASSFLFNYTFILGQYPSQTKYSQYVLRLAEITTDGNQYKLSKSRLPGDIEIFGRWVD